MGWKPSFEACPSKEQVDAAELQPEDVDEDVAQHQPAQKKQKTSILAAVASSSTKELSPCVDKASSSSAGSSPCVDEASSSSAGSSPCVEHVEEAASSSAGSSGSSSSRPKSSTDSDNDD